MTRYSISQPVTQVEAPRLLKGEGRYTDDVKLPFECHAVFLRSPHAHANIVGIDTKVAKQKPGVVEIFTGEDIARNNIGNVAGNSPPKRSDGRPGFRPPREPITQDRVLHVGQLVAMVIAESINQAKDAAEVIEVEYKILEAEIDPIINGQSNAPQLWPNAENNEAFTAKKGNADATKIALAAAPHIVKETMTVTRVAANTMEPRGCVGHYDGAEDLYTIYTTLQQAHPYRTNLAGTVLKVPESHVRVIAGDIGGSFGMKSEIYPEVALTLWASKLIGRPVKWTADRADSFLSDAQGRDNVTDVALALDAKGTFLAMRVRTVFNLGAYLMAAGPNPGVVNLGTLAGVYKTPAISVDVTAVFSNTNPTRPYRGAGRPEAAYVMERIIDIAAGRLGFDPVKLRRRNTIGPAQMPFKTGLTFTYDCGSFEANMDMALDMAGCHGFEDRRRAATARSDAS